MVLEVVIVACMCLALENWKCGSCPRILLEMSRDYGEKIGDLKSLEWLRTKGIKDEER